MDTILSGAVPAAGSVGLTFVDIFNIGVFIVFTVCYFYQLFYLAESLIRKHKVPEPALCNHKFAVLIAARNESATLGNLLHSLEVQSYPKELFDIYVIADNCDDDTAEIAESYGATVFRRHNKEKVGKGYALDYGYKQIRRLFPEAGYEAFMVFDADNILDPGYIEAMNRTLDRGAKASTSYRNSKNYADNWLSAGYAIWFLREARFLSQARQDLNTTCAISGTGFFIAADVLEESGGWKWHLLTEDIEFSADSAVLGRRIEYTPDAVLYDEQPTTFKDAWNQRERWAKGFYQVFGKYGWQLLKNMFVGKKGTRFGCYDMFMTIAPGMLLTIIIAIFNAAALALYLFGVVSPGNLVAISLSAILFCFVNYFLFMFLLGVITTFVEWDNIRGASRQKLFYIFTFPLFMMTYIPIAVVALFKKPQWKPIAHSVDVSIESFSQQATGTVQTDGLTTKQPF